MNELANLQAAATAIIAKLQQLEGQPAGVDPAAVQAVADQLNAALAPKPST